MEHDELIVNKSISLNIMFSDEFIHLDTGCIQTDNS